MKDGLSDGVWLGGVMGEVGEGGMLVVCVSEGNGDRERSDEGMLHV